MTREMTLLQRAGIFVFCASVLLAFAVSQSALAQTYTVLYNFTGGTDGAAPMSSLILDSGGNLYGTTRNGGDPSCIGNNGGCGVVFKLDPSGNEIVLHSFENGGDGLNPAAGLVMDSAGNLYGTTLYGGNASGAVGVVFKLDPSNNETILHSFSDSTAGFAGGFSPIGNLVLDVSGNIYGATHEGGDFKSCLPYGCGVIYRLTPSGRETVVHQFTDSATDGGVPIAGPAFDSLGNLYFTGTLPGSGSVFKLNSAGKLSTIELPVGTGQPTSPGGVTFDGSGNLFIPALKGGNGGGDNNAGAILKISSTGNVAGFLSCNATNCYAPNTGLVFDAAGNLYGTSQVDGTASGGTVFKIDTMGNFTAIHDFSIHDTNGYYPMAGLVIDSAGNLYGTTSAGGTFNQGVIFKITP